MLRMDALLLFPAPIIVVIMLIGVLVFVECGPWVVDAMAQCVHVCTKMYATDRNTDLLFIQGRMLLLILTVMIIFSINTNQKKLEIYSLKFKKVSKSHSCFYRPSHPILWDNSSIKTIFNLELTL